MLLVRQVLKQIWFLTNRVQRTRFWGVELCPCRPRNRVHWTRFLYMEIESTGLDFYSWKSSLLDSVFVQTQTPCMKLNPCFTLHKTEHTESQGINILSIVITVKTIQIARKSL